MRTADFQRAITVLALVALSAAPAVAGWNASPIEVHATSALCPLVASVDDGQNGAIVVWQENTASGGLLRAKHVLATGDLDAVTLTPRPVSNMDVPRHGLGGVSDGLGGAYVWWLEGTSLKLSHLTAHAAVSAGWPAGGRTLGSLPTAYHRPSVSADGQGGIYVAWIGLPLTAPLFPSARVIHLGVNNTPAGGWPTVPRILGGRPDLTELVNSVAILTASDGGLWLACATTVFNDPEILPGEIRILRLTAAGTLATGWSAGGVSLDVFHGDAMFNAPSWAPYWNPYAFMAPAAALVALAPTAGSGVYVAHAPFLLDGYGFVSTGNAVLQRVEESGVAAPGWLPQGVTLDRIGFGTGQDPGADGSVRALPDGSGGAFAGVPGYFADGDPIIDMQQVAADASPASGWFRSSVSGFELASRRDGGLLGGSFKPSGATSAWERDAYVSVGQSNGVGFGESVRSYYSTRYGDIGLSATRDGGAIFVWSQLIDRQGVYAIRLNPSGAVTGVNPTASATSLRLRFVRGQGVLAMPSLPGVSPMTLSLHDLAGRVVSNAITDGTPGATVAFPGTRDLPGGVYFARAAAGGRELHARVVVVR